MPKPAGAVAPDPRLLGAAPRRRSASVLALTHSGSSTGLRPPTDGSRDRVVAIDAVRDGERRGDAGTGSGASVFFQPGSVESSAGEREHGEVRLGPVGQQVAGDDRGHRASGRRARPDARRPRARTTASRSARSSWNCDQRSTWPRRPPEPPVPAMVVGVDVEAGAPPSGRRRARSGRSARRGRGPAGPRPTAGPPMRRPPRPRRPASGGRGGPCRRRP